MLDNNTLSGLKTTARCIGLSVGATLLTGSVAAADPSTVVPLTSVTELEVIQVFARLHELLRNIAYLLGPVILLHGITLWAMGSSESEWSERGYQAAIGGFILFGLSLAMDILLQMAAYIGTMGGAA
jgi:hypothetical protein